MSTWFAINQIVKKLTPPFSIIVIEEIYIDDSGVYYSGKTLDGIEYKNILQQDLEAYGI